MEFNAGRRTFLKTFTLVAVSVPLMGMLGGSSALAKEAAKAKGPAPLPAGQNPVPDTDAVAQAIGYVPASPKKGQSCKSCALYAPSNEGWGKCTMLSSGLVHSGGWCRSWSKKG